jgi:hypothetical protein
MAIIDDRETDRAPAPSWMEFDMNDLEKQIDELETRSAESALIAELATDPQARRYNSSLARELSDLAAKLRSQERGRIAPKQGRPAGG